MFLLDREFYTAEIFELFRQMNRTFLMPCVHTNPIKEMITEFKQGKRRRVSQHHISNKDGLRSSYYVIIIEIKKKLKKEYLVFATNNPRIDVEKYRKR